MTDPTAPDNRPAIRFEIAVELVRPSRAPPPPPTIRRPPGTRPRCYRINDSQWGLQPTRPLRLAAFGLFAPLVFGALLVVLTVIGLPGLIGSVLALALTAAFGWHATRSPPRLPWPDGRPWPPDQVIWDDDGLPPGH